MAGQEDDGGSSSEVLLHVYDLSAGMASALSPFLLGTQINAIYHTGTVVYGQEYYFGHGLNEATAGQTPFGRPHKVINMGKTFIPPELVREMLFDLAQTFTPESYNLMKNNCNNFSDSFCMFLVGKGIPEDIVRLPETVLNSPLGSLLRPVLEQLEQHLGSVGTGTTFAERGREEEKTTTRATSGGEGGRQDEGGQSRGNEGGEGTPREPGTEPKQRGSGGAEDKDEDKEPPSSLREEFEKLVTETFEKLMAEGKHTAQEAAILALSIVKEALES